MFRTARRMIETAATGAFATRERLRVYPALLLGAYALAGLALVLTGGENIDWTGRPIGADFGMMWGAGQTALAGRPEDVFALAQQASVQTRLFGEAAGFTPWHYPPVFLLVATPLAALPYLAALAVWLTASFGLYLVAIRACVGQNAKLAWPMLLLAGAFPAVFINAAHGQNAFLTTSLMTGAVLLLRTHPVTAGALFALLSYKPQFCALIPFLLLAQGHWRAIAAAVVTGGALLAGTFATFGGGVFRAFFASLPDTQRLTLELGVTGWEKIQSAFAAVRLVGGSYEWAMLAQVCVAALVILALCIVWRSGADMRLKQALVFPGALLTTPYCLDYDMVLLAPALILLGLHGLERGFARWEISLIALVFVTPIIARLVGAATQVPLGALVILMLFAWTLRRAMADARTARIPTLRTSPAPPLPSESSRLSP